MELHRRRKAFTLLELIVVIVILAILAVIAIPTFASVIGKSKSASVLTSMEAINNDAHAMAALEDRAVTLGDYQAAASETAAAGRGVLAAGVWTAVADGPAAPHVVAVSFSGNNVGLVTDDGNGRYAALETSAVSQSTPITLTIDCGYATGVAQGLSTCPAAPDSNPSPSPTTSPSDPMLAIFAGSGSSGTPAAGPATASPLGWPTNAAVDSSGNVYIADGQNHVVEKVDTSGHLSIFAGSGSSGTPVAGPATSSTLGDPHGVAVDAGGNVYIADASNSVIEKVDSSGHLSIFAGSGSFGTPAAGPATSSPLNSLNGLAVDSKGNVYAADGAYVVKVDTSGQLSIFAGNGSSGASVAGPATATPLGGGGVDGVAVDSTGNVYIVEGSPVVVVKVDTSGQLSIFAGNGSFGAPVAGPATSSPFLGSGAVAVDGSGNVYIADPSSAVVAKVDTSGQLSIFAGNGAHGAPVAGPATSSPLGGPHGLAVDSSGNVYIVDPSCHVVEKVSQ